MIEQTRDGVILKVRARPRSARDEVVVEGDFLRVSVRALPERNKANEAIVKVLSKRLGVRASALELLSGGRARDKRILVVGLTVEQVRARLFA